MNFIMLSLDMVIVTMTTFASFVMLITLFKNRGRLFTDPKPDRFPSVTIAVPAHNEEKNLGNVVEHLLNLDYPSKPEIIIVNDGSTDRTREIAESLIKKYHNIRLVNRKEKSGIKAIPVNEALKQANGEVFGFCDADVFMERNSLKNMIGYFNDEKVAAVIPMQKVYQPKNFLERLQKLEYILTSLAKKLLTFLNCLYLTPGCAFYRADVLRKIGGFDEKNLTEDLEIGLRLHKHGYRIENSVNSIVHVIVPGTFRKLTRERIRWFRGLMYNLRKHRSLFFEKSDFGLYLMPAILAGGILTILLFFFMIMIAAFDSTYSSWILLTGIILSGYDISLILPKLSFEPNIFFLLSVFFLFLFSINIYFSKKVSGESIRSSLVDALVFLVIYSPLLSFWWMASILQEILRVKKKW
ncbi:MAG: glycosyltransferase family 2 protein [Candidatus Aenigmatarchaeota archaeon]